MQILHTKLVTINLVFGGKKISKAFFNRKMITVLSCDLAAIKVPNFITFEKHQRDMLKTARVLASNRV